MRYYEFAKDDPQPSVRAVIVAVFGIRMRWNEAMDALEWVAVWNNEVIARCCWKAAEQVYVRGAIWKRILQKLTEELPDEVGGEGLEGIHEDSAASACLGVCLGGERKGPTATRRALRVEAATTGEEENACNT